jgi:ankyrin repeat protein
MSLLRFARSEKTYRNLLCIGYMLAFVVLLFGCSPITVITKDHEPTIRMTKPEAVRYLKQYLRNEKNLTVDEKHLAFTYQRKVIDRVTQSAPGLHGRGTSTTTTEYHWEDVSAYIEFAKVVKIIKDRLPVFFNEVLYVYDTKGIDLSGGGGFGWRRIDDEFISALLALCPNVKSDSSAANPSDEIYQSIMQGNSRKLLSLLEGNPELLIVKTNYGPLLYIAAENGNKDIVELLLAKGADVNAKTDRGSTPLHLAAFHNHRNVLELLLVKGAQVNEKSDSGCTPLYSAAEKNSMDAAKLLIAKGAEIDANAENGFSPLHIAAQNGYRGFVEILISRGAKVNAKSDFGYTPLYLAVMKNHRDVANVLIGHKAEVNLKTSIGWTPLHIAVWENHRDMVEFLISKGADLNAKSKVELTPLHIAVKKSHGEMVTLLILSGADINAKDSNGWTPLHVATQGRQWEIANLLRKNGGVE